MSRPNIGVLTSHPIQYQAPLFRKLAKRCNLTVYFAHKATPADQARAGFGKEFNWDNDLLSGYRSVFLENCSRKPGINGFFSCDTPGIYRIIKSNKYDAFIVSGWNLKTYWQAIYACRRNRVPLFVRGDSHLDTKRSLLKRAVKYPIYRILLKCFDAYLSVGKKSADYYRFYGVKEDKIFFVPHSVDVEYIRDRAIRYGDKVANLRKSLGLDGGRPCILYVGKLIPLKRVQDIISCARWLTERELSVQVVIVGSGSEERMLRNLAVAEKVDVSFVGFVNQSELPIYYSISDILVLSSETETWGYVVNEAFACGVPAIVSKAVGCGPDLVEDGKTGFVYPTGNISAMGKAVKNLCSMIEYKKPQVEQNIREKLDVYSLDNAVEGICAAISKMAYKS